MEDVEFYMRLEGDMDGNAAESFREGVNLSGGLLACAKAMAAMPEETDSPERLHAKGDGILIRAILDLTKWTENEEAGKALIEAWASLKKWYS